MGSKHNKPHKSKEEAKVNKTSIEQKIEKPTEKIIIEEKLKERPKPKSKTKFKISIYGDEKVGKTSILNRLLSNSFNENYIPTGPCKNYKININQYEIDFTDTSGNNKFSALYRIIFKNQDGYFLVYSVDNRESFEHLKARIEMIKESSQRRVMKIMLIGNKSDITESVVSEEEAKEFAKEHNIQFRLISCKNDEDIQNCLLSLIEEIKPYYDNWTTHICFIGNKGVGKTSLINQLLEKKCYYEGLNESEVVVNLEKSETVDLVTLHEIDYYEEQYYSIVEKCSGIIFVCSFDDKESFDSVKKMYEIIKSIVRNIEIIVICNKSDVDNKEINENDVKDFCNINNIKYISLNRYSQNELEDCFSKLVIRYNNNQ